MRAVAHAVSQAQRPRMAKAGLITTQDAASVHAADELALVIEAIGLAGMSDKEFALGAGLDQGQWARIKGGVGNLHWKTVRRQPAKFWIALDAVQRRRLGISEHTEEQIHQEQINATADALWTRLVDCFRKGTENAE